MDLDLNVLERVDLDLKVQLDLDLDLKLPGFARLCFHSYHLGQTMSCGQDYWPKVHAHTTSDLPNPFLLYCSFLLLTRGSRGVYHSLGKNIRSKFQLEYLQIRYVHDSCHLIYNRKTSM